MKSTGDPDRDRARLYHIRRAQTRKAASQRIGIAYDKMSEEQLWIQALKGLEVVLTALGEGTDRDLVYSARFAQGAILELMMRGHQLSLQFGEEDPPATGVAGGSGAQYQVE